MKRPFAFLPALLFCLLLAACGGPAAQPAAQPAPPVVPFPESRDYQVWAEETGYPDGYLVPQGSWGIGQDRYRTRPEEPGYASGRIVVGDSRCCQLGIYQQRTGREDFAVFGVWGGHYCQDRTPSILSDDAMAEIEDCFRRQAETAGDCVVYVFATVNDFDYESGDNGDSIAAAVRAAERVAAMSWPVDGSIRHPKVVVIGMAGCRDDGPLPGIPQEDFNRYVPAFNSALAQAVAERPLLRLWASYYTTVPAITGDGGPSFINDGIHYSDDTLRVLTDYLAGLEVR